MKATKLLETSNSSYWRVAFLAVGENRAAAFDRGQRRRKAAYRRWVWYVKDANLPPLSKTPAEATPNFL